MQSGEEQDTEDQNINACCSYESKELLHHADRGVCEEGDAALRLQSGSSSSLSHSGKQACIKHRVLSDRVLDSSGQLTRSPH